MGWILCAGKENAAGRYAYRLRILTNAACSFAPSQLLAPLTVPAPRRVALMVGALNSGAQMIQFKQELL